MQDGGQIQKLNSLKHALSHQMDKTDATDQEKLQIVVTKSKISKWMINKRIITA